jgi:hypothetical protein
MIRFRVFYTLLQMLWNRTATTQIVYFELDLIENQLGQLDFVLESKF